MTLPPVRVLIDVDGVLGDFAGHATKVVERISGAPLGAEHLKEWDLFKKFSPDVVDAFYAEFVKPGWCFSIPVYEGAKEGISLLQANGADIYYVTSPMWGDVPEKYEEAVTEIDAIRWMHERTEWLVKHFGADRKKIVHTAAKHLCVGDIFIDDKPEHIRSWQSHHEDGHAYLWEQSYNLHEAALHAKVGESIEGKIIWSFCDWKDIAKQVGLMGEMYKRGWRSKFRKVSRAV